MLGLSSVWAQSALPRATTATPVASGDTLLAEALDTLQRRPSVAARLRHQTHLYEHTLVGSGKYWQRGTAGQRVSRWEMQTQVAGKTASFVQVFDGNHLWTDRRLPSGREVHRLDVARLQMRLGARTPARVRLTASDDRLEALTTAVEGQGGLAQMLADLLGRFTFDPPRPIQLNGAAASALVGHWRKEQLVRLWPELNQTGNDARPEWPEQLPHHVLVIVDQSDLFPYVVEYRRSSDAYLASTAAGQRLVRDPLVRYEIFDVQFAQAMDDRLFEFKPGDVQWTDETALVLERLRQQRGDAPVISTARGKRRRMHR